MRVYAVLDTYEYLWNVSNRDGCLGFACDADCKQVVAVMEVVVRKIMTICESSCLI